MENLEPLSVVYDRVGVSITFGSIVCALCFAVWCIVVDQGGPVIGVLVFLTIGLVTSTFLLSRWLKFQSRGSMSELESINLV